MILRDREDKDIQSPLASSPHHMTMDEVVPIADIQVHTKEAGPINDGECSDTQSNTEDLSEVSDITAEQTPIVDVTPDKVKVAEDSPSKQYKAPEPPRWRFNRQSSIIKSSAGYSSAHAGSYIKGKSSEELGGKYNAPEISYVEKIKHKQREVSELPVPDIKYSVFKKEEREVGKLSQDDIASNEVGKNTREVGKLAIDNLQDELIEVLEGGIVISHDKSDKEEIDIGSRVWANHQPRTKDSSSSNNSDKDKWLNLLEIDNTSDAKLKEVGRLQFSSTDDCMDEEFDAGVSSKHEKNSICSQDAADTGMLFLTNDDDSTTQSDSDSKKDHTEDAQAILDDDISSKCDTDIVAQEPRRRQKSLILLLLLLLLIISAIIGVVLGKKDDTPDEEMVSVVGAVVSPNITSQMPSSLPSSIPSKDIVHGLFDDAHAPTLDPIVSDTSFPSFEPSMQETTYQPSTSPTTASPTQQPLDFLGPCPDSFVIQSSYGMGAQVQVDGIVYECTSDYDCGGFAFEPGSSFGLWQEKWEVVGSCSGTLAPTTLIPTLLPSRQPSISPSTLSPSTSPATTSPTKLPLAFMGGCPGSFTSSTSYGIGSQVQVDGIVYECTSDYDCGGFAFEPASSFGLWQEKWMLVGSCSGTLAPTTSMPTSTQPSISPVTDMPSLQPSISPITGSPSLIPSRSPNTSSPTSFAPISKAPITQSPSRSPTIKPSLSPMTNAPTTIEPSKSPSKAPNAQPTRSPSRGPSKVPTLTPSNEPTPSPSLEPSPPPTLYPTPSPSFEPSLEPTTPLPTLNPTIQPSIATLDPTTSKPTCLINGDFNLCLAIDMSGSVCHGQGQGLCENCGQCNSGGFNLATCCSNFSNMLEFSKDLVKALGDLPSNQDFSVVHFASDVAVADTLENANQAFKTIKTLKYTGGKTNLAGAIDSCQSTLDNASLSNRKNLMLILTDGYPSLPSGNPEGSATNAATKAKNKGTFIIPVFIEDPNSQNNQAVNFLKNSISSDGSLFLADFTGLTALQETVFDQVTCQ